MANMKFIATNQNKLAEIPIKDGQVIFARDEQVIYLDSNSKRYSFKNILTIDTEVNRETTVALEGCFYYVKESKLIYRYEDSQWNCLNSSEIIFNDRESFPQTGDPTKLYVSENAIYKWDGIAQQYIKVGSGNIMEELEWGSI